MTRAMKTLRQKGDPPPYFMSYHVTERHDVRITGAYGALRENSSHRGRMLDVDVRVGDYDLDNTHQIRGAYGYDFSSNAQPVELPLEDNPAAIKSRIWLATDRRYKSALERLIQVRANRAVMVREEDSSADFSREKFRQHVSAQAMLSLDIPAMEKRIKRFSAIFKNYPEMYESSVLFNAEAINTFLVNSEGSSLQHGRLHLRLGILARTRAADGMELYRFESFDVTSPDRLPDDATVTAAIERMVQDLLALRAAPVIEPYTGPAILSGRASGVFFHEIFGHRIEGHRQKDESDGQTFTKKVGQKILPDFLSVYDDPTLGRLEGVDLNGTYEFDDEGVKSERVTVVENGVLRNFLMSRSPVQGFERSNGHGRKAAGYDPVGRQGNLIIQASKTVTEERLRQMLIEECRKQGKPYGLIFKDIAGGFTFTGRDIPQSFKVLPIMVYRVYADGRPDELVRGVDLIGTPLTSFSKIIAAGDRVDVFNGLCGAESGRVPVAAASPSILTTEIEVQKKVKSSDLPPILPPPGPGKPN